MYSLPSLVDVIKKYNICENNRALIREASQRICVKFLETEVNKF
jgi:hypothetical protein